MRIKEDCQVIYLDKDDLTAHGAIMVFDDVGLFDFIFTTKSPILKADIVIFKNNGKYRVLKSRY